MVHILLTILLAAACSGTTGVPEEDFSRAVSDHLSSGQVNAFAEDPLGHVWVATSRGLNRYDGRYYHQFFASADSLSLPDNHVNDLCFDRDGLLWVATWSGIACMDDEGRFHRISGDGRPGGNVGSLAVSPSGDIFAVYDDRVSVCRKGGRRFLTLLDTPETYGLTRVYPGSRNSLWVVTIRDVYCLDAESGEVESTYAAPHPAYRSFMTSDGILVLAGLDRVSAFDVMSRRFRSLDVPLRGIDLICEPEDGMLLFVSTEGALLYDRKRDVLVPDTDSAFPFALPGSQIQNAFCDSNGLLWLGCADQGFSVVSSTRSNPYGDKKHIREFFQGKSIACLAASEADGLWVSTKRDGLFYCKVDEDRVIPIPVGAYLENTPPGLSYCNRLMTSRDGSLWLCFLGNGTLLHARFTGSGLEPIRVFRDIQAPDHLLEAEDGSVWVGTSTGRVYRYGDGRLEDYSPFFTGQVKLMDGLLQWDDGRVLLSSSSGGICLADGEGNLSLVSEKPVIPPFRDHAGRVWTYVLTEGWAQITDDGLRSVPLPAIRRTISSICEDREGDFWVGTHDGLLRLDPASGELVSFYSEDGIAGNEFADACAACLPDGHLVFGGPQGLTLFVPLSGVQERKVPVCFQELSVHRRLVRPGPDAPVKKLLYGCSQVKLNHLQNSFSISYAALDYVNRGRINYSYRMEGQDPYWIDAGHGMEAHYSNLRPGRYTFRVKATDSAGTLMDSEAALAIRVVPNPWQSWWAVCLYILLGIGLLSIGLYQAALRRRRDSEAAELSRLNTMQMNFFANVAHEFRTPLTMIAGPVSALSASDRIAGQDRKMLSVMQRSVNWMLHLVNQILDFNRLEGDRLELKVAKQDIVPYVKEVLEVFLANADAKGITLSDQVDGGFQLWMDRDKVTKILMNLLSNALKFTPSGGQIEVTMDVLSRERAQALFPLQEKDTDNRYVYLSVKDTGPGIPEEQLERIFERFYQLKRGQVALGSGIGLYYSRSLATIHHGYLRAWNRTDTDSGAVFGLLLPVSESSYSESERASEAPASFRSVRPEVRDEREVSPEGKRTVLVVDDDVDIANYLRILLQTQYRVRTCFDVDSALEAVGEEMPDLILSDVMMPGRSGFDLCESVKGNLALCHIPVILVTAMDQVSRQVEGLEKGADAYVTKPFDPAYLLALIGSQLENRDKLRYRLGSVTSVSEVEDTRMAPQDKAFMKELYRLMEEELSNPELDVSTLTEKMHISRSKFYYKVKGLTGENPGDFFRRYKLNKAAELLLDGKLNVSEVADRTGFSSLSYFSSCFKKHFGVPPSEYKG